MNKIIILSHKNPDTDSISASLIAEEYIQKTSKKISKAYRAGELNNETKFILDRFKVEAPQLIGPIKENVKVMLVDHNSLEEAIDGLKSSQIEAVIDHHKLTLRTDIPIFCLTEALGSTCTILAKLYFQARKRITPKIAKLIIAGILSDTLNLTSPTTTEEDKRIVKNLNKIAKIKIADFTRKMFEAKSDITGLTPRDIIEKDYKLFQMGTKKVGIAGWETLKTDSIIKIKEKIIAELQNKKAQGKLDYVFLFLVDIMKQDSVMFIAGEAEKTLAEKVFGGKEEGEFLFLKGVVSRKKQVVPPMMAELTK